MMDDVLADVEGGKRNVLSSMSRVQLQALMMDVGMGVLNDMTHMSTFEMSKWLISNYPFKLSGGFHSKLPLVDGAIEALEDLKDHYDIWILTTAPWRNPIAWTEKIEWLSEHFPCGEKGYDPTDKVIMCSQSTMVVANRFRGDVLVTTTEATFNGEVIQFDNKKMNWSGLKAILINRLVITEKRETTENNDD